MPRGIRLAMAVAVMVAALVLVILSGPWAGPVLLKLSRNHGVHAGDVVVLAGATLMVIGLVR